MTAISCCASSSPPPAAPILCFFCGEPEVVELFEIWDREFIWETYGTDPAGAALPSRPHPEGTGRHGPKPPSRNDGEERWLDL